MHDGVEKSSFHEEQLETYLNSFLENPMSISFSRRKCCGTSRSLYCIECCRLLIDKERWPLPLQLGHLDLPFNLDIILSDRRQVATGFHAHILLKASTSASASTSSALSDGDDNDHTDIFPSQRVRLFDTKEAQGGDGDLIPSYENDDQTFVLFPSSESIPLSLVSDKIKRLIVLDCKWTKSGSEQRSTKIANLPQVHLDTQPSGSFFWRWHSAGEGMCSTLEAIYYAAVQVSTTKEDFTDENRKALIHLMWLFGIQRASTAASAERNGKPLPFSKQGKQKQELLRRTEKGSEKHLRDIEQGRKLKEKENVRKMKES